MTDIMGVYEEIVTHSWEVTSIAIGVFVAISMYRLEQKRRAREEKHARKTVVENLTEGSKLFVELTKTARRPESESMESEILSNIDFFFQENHEKIRDIIRFTRIYLNEWRDLPLEDKIRVEASLKDLSWLLTEFYPIHKPDLIKQGKAIENRVALSEKNDEIIETLKQIQNKQNVKKRWRISR